MIRLDPSNKTHSKIYWIAENISADDFPDVDSALHEPEGLLAIGGDLGPTRLLHAYQQGIFPWYNPGQPVLWWSPDPRCVLLPEEIHISSSLAKLLRKDRFRISFNQVFDRVIHMCAEPRDGNPDTWISAEIIRAYTELHKLGHILSVECWEGNQLVGGLYGVVIGQVYFGESMFSRVANASKVALVHLADELRRKGFRLIDCQIWSRHLHSLGARNIPRQEFVNLLEKFCGSGREYVWPTDSPSP
jgi:leucyl/phenylalanyl-tRNA--protein transferase